MNDELGKDNEPKAEGMTLPCKFVDGPLHGMIGNVSSLPESQIFFSDRDKKVFYYIRSDELAYTYDRDVSEALTEKYDDSMSRFKESQTIETWGRKRLDK